MEMWKQIGLKKTEKTIKITNNFRSRHPILYNYDQPFVYSSFCFFSCYSYCSEQNEKWLLFSNRIFEQEHFHRS